MKNRKLLSMLSAFALICAVLCFAACSNGDDSDSNSTTSASEVKSDETNVDENAVYTVTFDADGGSFAEGEDGFTLSEDKTRLTVTVKRGAAIPKPSAEPSKAADEDGTYRFYGWTEKDTLPAFDFTRCATEDLTLYAHYVFIPDIDESAFTDDSADRDGDGVSDGKVNDSDSAAANAVKNLHVDGSDSALYFWWDWASGVSGYRAVLSIPAEDESAEANVIEVQEIIRESGNNTSRTAVVAENDEYGEASFFALDNERTYLFTVMPLGTDDMSLAATALASPKIEMESPDLLLLMYLDEDDDLAEVTQGLNAVRTESGEAKSGYQSVDAIAFRRTADGDAHLIAFDDESGEQVDISYTWEGIERTKAEDGSYCIAGVDFDNGAFFENFLAWAKKRFIQQKLVAYIEAPVAPKTLALALQSATTSAGLVAKKLCDLIIFGGSHDMSLEALWNLAPYAEYIAGSPDYHYGGDLEKVIKSFTAEATAKSIATQLASDYRNDNERSGNDWEQTKADFTSTFSKEFFESLDEESLESALNFYAISTVPSFTVADCAKIDAVASAWDSLADAISKTADNDFTITDYETEEETDFIEAVQMLFSDPAMLNSEGEKVSLYYTGTYGEQSVWNYDIAYAASGIKAAAGEFATALATSDPTTDTAELAAIQTKANAVITAMKAAVVTSWRTSLGESDSLYDELKDDSDNALPCGITITGAVEEDDEELTVPTDGATPSGYNNAFNGNYTSWGALLWQWFGN